ncbi:hypothetical protein GCM10012275_17640 [Longimycelium tulufanense]|uniref:Uncharacterized protein n=1 Tax=Longimycelium tulufanense TaxID=907463 RepID=A0A8J3CE51_9PSEU|nr:hypothetical protein [Longimycelium tulufanense]GGM47042.1 hypothetical protein GCM10012275_17640 [Longimycelium tulufanense]
MLWRVIGVLLVAWLALSLVGALIKGLFWLAVIGGALFLGTAAVGWAKKGRLPR